ncbi:MAG: hypothetical protein CO118_10165, partial [Flavobacteriales bacterium CG_4_9_14_3_um_filter_32_8]
SKDKWHVETYLHNPIKIKHARDISHYDESMLKSIIKQNHLNASFFEIAIFISLFIFGLFSEIPFFIIPAGASIILFFTMLFILMSAFYTWLKGWTTIVIVGVFILINFLSKSEFFTYSNMAYGLNYNIENADYSVKNLKKLSSSHNKKDYENSLAILDNWKKKNSSATKPKIIFINTSGGGTRSTMWTFYMLQVIEKLTDEKLFHQTHLITGSSGGMIGAAYFRELYLQKKTLKKSIYAPEYLTNISKDLLNPIAFSIATNDFFLRTKKYYDGKYTYWKDRGYSFERQLLINTDNALNKRLRDYHLPEYNSEIPIMILSPTVINDARRMLISAQPISYLTNNNPIGKVTSEPIVENFEFSRLFEKQDASNLRFTSALRMSATFPIIMPRVSLPSNPQITVMDAGMRDNFGKITTYRFIYTFKEWINSNTSGIIIISFRDKQKNLKIKDNSLRSITETFFSPVGSLYENLFPIQDYNQDDMLQYLGDNLEQPIDVFDFELDNSENNISLSWHLTTKEKEIVLNSIYSVKNQKVLNKLVNTINE